MTTNPHAVPAGTSAARSSAGWTRRAERFVVPIGVVFALLVHVPVVTTPRFYDDYNHVAMIEGRYPSPPGPFGLYDFINDANRAQLMERGVLPWWSYSKLELRFLRPLSSAVLWAGERCFGPSNAIAEHLLSLAVWAAASLGVYLLLRRLFSRRVAGLGLLIFAVAPCHGYPLSWLANREALISTAIGACALAYYVRWRAGRRPRDGIVSLALFTLAMLAGEYSLCFGGYIVGVELTRPRESLLRRSIGLAAFALPSVVYLATRHSLHYGAFGTGFYHDPLRDFGAYAESAPRRFSILLGTAWLGVDDRVWTYASSMALVLLVLASVGVVALPLARAFRALDAGQRRWAVAMFIGSVLSIVPVMAVGASARLLEIPMIGVSASVALILDQAWFPGRPLARRGAAEWSGLLALVLAFVHLVRAPLDSFLWHRYLRNVAAAGTRQMAWMREHARDKSYVFVLRTNEFQTMFVEPLMVDGTVPVRTLSLQSGPLLLLRTGPRTIELVAGPKPLFPVGAEDLVRNADEPLRVGATVSLSGMRATLVALRDDGTPRVVRYEFDRDLDDPGILWVLDRQAGFEEQTLPEPGYGAPLRM
jgi:Dolichyl-phosphate-mannose-protein mannosyltransferase